MTAIELETNLKIKYRTCGVFREKLVYSANDRLKRIVISV